MTHKHDAELYFQRTTLHSALFVAIGLGAVYPYALASTSAHAAELGARIGVSVNVIANAAVRTDYQASQLQIAPADIARGYVDATSATRFSVKTNSRQGYLMVFEPLLDVFDSVQVMGLKTIAHLGRDGGVVVQRWLHPSETAQDLSFRFFLSTLAVPGDYPWPLHLSVRALE